MALQRQNNNGIAKYIANVLGAYALNNPANAFSFAEAAGNSIGRDLKKKLNSQNWASAPGNPPATGGGGGSRGRKGNNQRRRRGKESLQKLASGDSFRQIGFGPTTGIPSLRTRIDGLITLTTPSTGPSNAHYMLGHAYQGNAPLFTLLNTDAIKLMTAFEKAVVHRVTIKFVGTSPSTASGFFALGMDSSTDASSNAPPSSAQTVTNSCTHVVIADVKGEATLTYTPKGSDREVRLNDNTAGNAEMYCGKTMWGLYGSNIAASTTYGLLSVDVDITFMA